MNTSDVMIGPASHYYISQRLRLHYVDWGNDQATPLVMVHGGRDHCRNWDWVAQILRTDYHIIAPDLRGHGDSQWAVGSAYQLSDYVVDLAQLIHQKFPGEKISLMGHSLGGTIALIFAGLYPDKVKKVISIEGLGADPDLRRQLKRPPSERILEHVEVLRNLAGRIPPRYNTIEECVSRMQQANPRLTPGRARHLTIHGVNQNEDGTFTWKFDNYTRTFGPSNFTNEELGKIWTAINCPVLFLYGEESFMEFLRRGNPTRHIKECENTGIEFAGHWVHHDALRPFLEVTLRFLGTRQR